MFCIIIVKSILTIENMRLTYLTKCLQPVLFAKLIESSYDIFENQFHVLKLCFDMFNTSLIYNLRFYNLGNYKKVNVLYNNSLKVS